MEIKAFKVIAEFGFQWGETIVENNGDMLIKRHVWWVYDKAKDAYVKDTLYRLLGNYGSSSGFYYLQVS